MCSILRVQESKRRMGPIGYPETSVKITTTRCVITQKSAVLTRIIGYCATNTAEVVKVQSV